MSRQDRLKEYAKPLRAANWQGAGRDQANIDRWADRASENSKLAPRASKGEMQLHDTGKAMAMRSTTSRPYRRDGDGVIDQARSDMNIEGDSKYLAGIRRTT